jgi:hypothetical protein
MTTDDDPAVAANHLWSAGRHAVLGTQSLAHPGYPFGSVVPYVLDRHGEPLLLLSPLSQHTKNIDAQAHCCLTLTQPGDGDVQQRQRLTVLGDVARTEPGDDAQRYFRYFPQSRSYHDELGFVFYRFTSVRLHWNGGFATARWLGTDRVIRPNPLDAATESRIVGHMNADHRDALRGYLEHYTEERPGDAPVEMLGIDGLGLDLRCAERMPRVTLPRPVATAGEAREVLVEMAQATG